MKSRKRLHGGKNGHHRKRKRRSKQWLDETRADDVAVIERDIGWKAHVALWETKKWLPQSVFICA